MSEFNWGALLQGVGAGISAGNAPATPAASSTSSLSTSDILLYGGLAVAGIAALLYFVKR